ncbi:MAG: phosphotransferase [Bacteroidales bacterium]
MENKTKLLAPIINQFTIKAPVLEVKPLGNGLINDTYLVKLEGFKEPSYVLQRINHEVFKDVELLQHNIEVVTNHIRRKLIDQGEKDINRKVLHFLEAKGGKTYYFDGKSYWRLMDYISDTVTYNNVTPEYAEYTGAAFGSFQAMLIDVKETLGETIPNFHTMSFRLKQLQEAVETDVKGRMKEVKPLVDDLMSRSEWMCQAETYLKEGTLKKRICHCDTKLNNILFDKNGQVLCIIDLDTLMPGFIGSDVGDFLRTAASTSNENDKEYENVSFKMDIYKPFVRGYLSKASFLTDLEISLIPFSACLFPYMQAVRFLTDYINGDTYYKIQYPEQNMVRTRNQIKLWKSVEEHLPAMKAFIDEIRK